MAEHKITWAQLKRGSPSLTLTAGEPHTIIVQRSSFELQVFDGAGKPVPELAIAFAQGSESTPVSTNADGVAQFKSARPEDVLAKIADLPATRECLSKQWAANGYDGRLAERGLQILALQDLAPGVSVDADRRLKVALPPRNVKVRLIGMHFDSAKCFLLPGAMTGIRRMCRIYEDHPDAHLLVVGHTDTTDSQTNNATLSLERAESVAAFLTDQVDSWLGWYADEKPDAKRWGTLEDQHMLSALPNASSPYLTAAPSNYLTDAALAAIKRFQAAEGLKPDGDAGPKTRRILVKRYMELDGTSLPSGCTLVTHGCGELFPAEDLGNDKRSEANRRVELFLFDGDIAPPPAGPVSSAGSTQYTAWCAQVSRTVDVSGAVSDVAFSVKLTDAELDPKAYADKRFQLTVEDRTLDGRTTADGMVVQTIPATATRVLVRLWLNEPAEPDNVKEWSLRVVEDLPSPNTLRGMLARLYNLGYYDKDGGESFGDDERFAVRWFQVDHDIPEDGQWTNLDTRAMLVQKHGC